jgi:hypothetical protein
VDQWIDKVHQWRPPKRIALDMDSSESPTCGEQEGTACNGHFGLQLLPPAVRVQPSRRCRSMCTRTGQRAQRRAAPKPVIARCRGIMKCLQLRGDATFANPEMYEFLEAQRIRYTIRLPANDQPPASITSLLTAKAIYGCRSRFRSAMMAPKPPGI